VFIGWTGEGVAVNSSGGRTFPSDAFLKPALPSSSRSVLPSPRSPSWSVLSSPALVEIFPLLATVQMFNEQTTTRKRQITDLTVIRLMLSHWVVGYRGGVERGGYLSGMLQSVHFKLDTSDECYSL